MSRPKPLHLLVAALLALVLVLVLVFARPGRMTERRAVSHLAHPEAASQKDLREAIDRLVEAGAPAVPDLVAMYTPEASFETRRYIGRVLSWIQVPAADEAMAEVLQRETDPRLRTYLVEVLAMHTGRRDIGDDSAGWARWLADQQAKRKGKENRNDL